jgi:hypothetical protein
MTPAVHPRCSDRVLAWRAVISTRAAEGHRRSVCRGLLPGNKACKPAWCYLCPPVDLVRPLADGSSADGMIRWSVMRDGTQSFARCSAHWTESTAQRDPTVGPTLALEHTGHRV